MANDYSEVKALVFLYKTGNHRNKILLFDNYLMVINRGNKNSFRLEDISNIYFTRHKILIPIVVGGIIASFSLIAIFVSFYSPLLIISIFITGVLVLYLGYNGEDVMVVDLKVKHEYFPLRYISANLRAFVHFLNNFLKAGQEPYGWYIYVPKEQIDLQEDKTFHPLKAYTYEQMQKQKRNFSQKNDKTFVALNPFHLRSEIKFERIEGEKVLYPMIYGAINQEAIVKNGDVEF